MHFFLLIYKLLFEINSTKFRLHGIIFVPFLSTTFSILKGGIYVAIYTCARFPASKTNDNPVSFSELRYNHWEEKFTESLKVNNQPCVNYLFMNQGDNLVSENIFVIGYLPCQMISSFYECKHTFVPL